MVLGGCPDESGSEADTASGDTAGDAAEDVVPDTTEDSDGASEEVLDTTGDVTPDAGANAGWTLSVGTPERIDGRVRASVTFARESGAETRGGGVCLVADLYETACSEAADCASLALPAGGFHYCARSQDGDDTRCWTRPGPPERYCTRSPMQMPGTYATPEVPALVVAAPTTWMAYGCLAVADNPGGCGTSDPSQFVSATSSTLVVDESPSLGVKIYGVDGNMGDFLCEAFEEPNALLGMCGTNPGGIPDEGLVARLLERDPELWLFFFAAETYDAVVIAALAAEVARDSSSAAVAAQLAAVTTGGEKCTTFESCKALIDAGVDIDYDGLSGPLELDEAGEPAVANYTRLQFGADNRIDLSQAEAFLVGDPSDASPSAPEVPPRSTEPQGGPLSLGGLLPLTGNLEFFSPTIDAAIRLAVDDVNAAGGVNGMPALLTVGDSGDPVDNRSPATLETFIDEGIQVIIGPLSSAVTLSIIDDTVSAGIVMISPANTSDALTTHPDQGLYFRTAPPDAKQGQALAQLITGDGHRVVGVLANETPYGTGLSEALVSNLHELGVSDEGVSVTIYGFDPFDPGPGILAMQWHQPSAIALIGFEETIELIGALEAVGLGPSR